MLSSLPFVQSFDNSTAAATAVAPRAPPNKGEIAGGFSQRLQPKKSLEAVTPLEYGESMWESAHRWTINGLDTEETLSFLSPSLSPSCHTAIGTSSRPGSDTRMTRPGRRTTRIDTRWHSFAAELTDGSLCRLGEYEYSREGSRTQGACHVRSVALTVSLEPHDRLALFFH
ncbi:hypothetical protein CDEST_09854 [Colletotrichum destructivum]|uniref:Uncharacterized protein n=1 Tax=Colletotrichum destructivum TaxID=34406 RepID=A0AAX4IPE7_9PEZI|nr:hypothetical protein CDEST_09854 [Colletotrichum destructivum]